MGSAEVFLIVIGILWLLLPFVLRRWYSGRVWVAVVLGFMYPLGQVYVKEKAWRYVIGLAIFAWLFHKFGVYAASPVVYLILVCGSGALIAYYRIKGEL